MTFFFLLSLVLPSLSAEPARATRLEKLTLLPTDTGLLAILEADGPIEHRLVQEQNPDEIRVVIDLLGVSNPLRHYYPAENHPFLARVLMYEYPAATNPNGNGPLARIVFELKRRVDFRLETTGNELRIVFTDLEAIAASDGDEVVPSLDGGETRGDVDLVDSDVNDVDVDVEPDEFLDANLPPNLHIVPEDVSPSLFFESDSPDREDYRLGPEDVIEVRVFELDQLNRTIRVSGDGSIELPLVGRLGARGLTAKEVAAAVADRLRDRYVQNPQVSIFITEFNSQRVSLLGAVQTPSSYPLVGQRRLLQVLAEAGSLTADAGSTLYIFRQSPDGRSARLTVPLNELLMQGDPRWNVALRAGDVVSVPPEAAIAISVLGAVVDPGVHKVPVGNDATLLKAIALAGGLNDRASKKGLQIKRRGLDGKESIIKVNFGDILSGKTPDLILQEGDVVVVHESFF